MASVDSLEVVVVVDTESVLGARHKVSVEPRRLSRLPRIVESDRHLGSDVTMRSHMSSVMRPSRSRCSSYSWTTHIVHTCSSRSLLNYIKFMVKKMP